MDDLLNEDKKELTIEELAELNAAANNVQVPPTDDIPTVQADPIPEPTPEPPTETHTGMIIDMNEKTPDEDPNVLRKGDMTTREGENYRG